ncbi:MAG: hypothetical protein J6M56_08105 [Clostridia bacterium]|nr:hypothetical protein [Clostridia bacterium]
MKKVRYMIGNAHLDPVWLWRWQDGYEAARAAFRSVLAADHRKAYRHD